MKILIFTDTHLREKLAYSDKFADGRESERKEVFALLHAQAKACDKVVICGDVLNARTNSPETLRMLVAFLEGFGSKELVVLSGNHSKSADGRSALDFLKEVKGHNNWTIVTNSVIANGDCAYSPYFYRHEYGVDTNEEASAKLVADLQIAQNTGARFLFTHNSIAGTRVNGSQMTDDLREIVLPKESLAGFKKVFAGHIHKRQSYANIEVVGNVFTNEIGETNDKVALIYDTEKDAIEEVKLPVRRLDKVVEGLKDGKDVGKPFGFAKIVLNKKHTEAELKEIKANAEKNYEAYVIVEDLPRERAKSDEVSDVVLSPETLLDLYCKERGVDRKEIKEAWDLIQ